MIASQVTRQHSFKGGGTVLPNRKEKDMKEYEVSYYLHDMHHCCIVEADNEAEAILKELKTLNDRSKEIMHDFKIERYYQSWN